MRFRLLGPLEIEVDGRLVEFSGLRQRRLLGALLLEVGRVVSEERLAEIVWYGDALPESAIPTMRTYVSRIRQSLRSSEVIVNRDGGYAAVLDGHTTDVQDFEGLVRRAEAASNSAGSIDLFTDSLALWRGALLGELSEEAWVLPQLGRLDEIRASAVEARAQAQLDLGLNGDVLVGLGPYLGEWSRRESIRGLHMTALYRSGREADALESFQEHRRLLAEDTGLEPGKELVELERRILGHDPSLDRVASGRPLRGYTLGDVIGEGAFSLVYRGTQPSLGREVAVKQIRAELANRPEFIRRFEAEAQMIAHLEHPYVVPLYDYWREPDTAYLIMRWLRGGTLEDRLAQGRLDVDEALKLVRQVGSALGIAHRAGVVHRDVKPANVFLDGEGDYFLGDFGIALGAEDLSDPSAALSAGSPAYASPEQLRREAVGPPSDVHGLGISVFEALTGQLPFPTENTQASLLNRQLNDTIPLVRSTRTDVPDNVDEVLQRATAKDPADRYQSIEEFVRAFEDAIEGSESTPHQRGVGTLIATGDASNPYRGLRPFNEPDSNQFFGRDRLVDELVNSLKVDGSLARLVTVVGPSGSGKSSAVHAGLIPALRAGAVTGSSEWFITSMTPGESPFEELETALLRVAVNPPDQLLGQLTQNTRGISRATRRILPDAASELLIVIDQFEELFTLCDNPQVRRKFLDGLAAAVTDSKSQVRIVLTLRADFYDRPLRHSGIASLVKASTVIVAPLAPDELEQAIVHPAQMVGCEFEPGLVSEIVADVADQPGALPLLQYALTELWERRVSGLFTRQSYRDIGGVAGALAARAEELYQEIDDEARAGAKRVFGRLITLGEGSEDTRRRVLMSELRGDPVAPLVVELYGNSRLLSFDRDVDSREPTVEVAHEALIREWPRLKLWVEDNRDGLRVHRHLTTAAKGWGGRDRDSSELYRGGRLDAALEWTQTDNSALNEVEREFLDASRTLRDAEVRREKRRVTRLRSILAATAVIATIAVIASIVAVGQRSEANEQRDLASVAASDAEAAAEAEEVLRVEAEQSKEDADRAAEQADVERARAEQVAYDAEIRRMISQAPTLLSSSEETALLVALEAHRQAPSNDTIGALQATLVDLPVGWLGTLPRYREYSQIEPSSEPGIVVLAGPTGIDRVDSETGERLGSAELETSGVELAVSVPAQTVVIAADDGRWWTALEPDLELTERPRLEAGIETVLANPAAPLIAFGLGTGEILVHDLVTGEQNVVGQLSESAITLAWHDDGVLLAAGGGDGVAARVFDTGRLRQFGPDMVVSGDLGSGSALVGFVGDRLMVVNGPAVVFDVELGVEVLRAAVGIRNRGWISPLDDGRVAVVGWDGRSVAIDPLNGQVEQLQTIDTSATDLLIAPDLSVMAVTLARVLSAHLAEERLLASSLPALPDGHSGGITDDGSIVLDGYRTTIRIWDTSTVPRLLEEIPAFYARAYGDTVWIAVVENGAGAHAFWSRESGFSDWTPQKGIMLAFAVSPDGEMRVHPFRVVDRDAPGEAATDSNVTVRDLDGNDLAVLRDIDNAQLDQPLSFRQITDVEFTPDGRRLVATSVTGVWAAWDTESWQLIHGPVTDDPVFDFAFSPDGSVVATLERDGTLTLRDASDYSPILPPIEAHDATRFGGEAIRFSADGDLLFSNGGDGVHMWDANTLEAIGIAFQHDEGYAGELAPDAQVLMTYIDDRIVLWNVDVDAWPAIACRAVGRNMTAAEWEEYAPAGQEYQVTCPQWSANA